MTRCNVISDDSSQLLDLLYRSVYLVVRISVRTWLKLDYPHLQELIPVFRWTILSEAKTWKSYSLIGSPCPCPFQLGHASQTLSYCRPVCDFAVVPLRQPSFLVDVASEA